MNQRIRIHLKNKQDGEKLVITPLIFNENNGLMQYPVDLSVWDVEKLERSSGLLDYDKTEIFEGDEIWVMNAKGIYPDNIYLPVVYVDGSFKFKTENGEYILNQDLIKQHQIIVVKKK